MNYSGVNAKVKAMKSRLLKYSDYKMLSSMNSVNEVGTKLKELYSYKDTICKISDSKKLTRNILELKLELSLSEDFVKIYNFIHDIKLKKYLKAFILSDKIKLIKYMLCIIYDERKFEYTEEDIKKILKYDIKLDIEKIISSKSVYSFIESLKDTEFYEILSIRYDENVSLFDLEMTLDLYYYMHLWKLQNKYLDKKNFNIMSNINGVEIDLQNIVWIYRLKTYYKIDKDLMYTYLIPINYNLSREKIINMVESKTKEDLKNEILNTKYGIYFKEEENLSLEKISNNILKDTYDRAVHLKYNSISVIVNYIFYKNLEIKNLVSLLEGVRYNLKPNEIMEYMTIK